VDWKDIEEKGGTGEEQEALRAVLMAFMRRQPGDTRASTRLATALSRMAAAEGRMSRKKNKGLFARYAETLAGFHEVMRPEDDRPRVDSAEGERGEGYTGEGG
jgi:hypothetical protein